MKISYHATDYISPVIMGEIKRRERDTTVFMWLNAFKNMPDEDKASCVLYFVNEAKGAVDIVSNFREHGDAIVSRAALDGLQDLALFITNLLLSPEAQSIMDKIESEGE